MPLRLRLTPQKKTPPITTQHTGFVFFCLITPRMYVFCSAHPVAQNYVGLPPLIWIIQPNALPELPNTLLVSFPSASQLLNLWVLFPSAPWPRNMCVFLPQPQTHTRKGPLPKTLPYFIIGFVYLHFWAKLIGSISLSLTTQHVWALFCSVLRPNNKWVSFKPQKLSAPLYPHNMLV